MQPTPPKPPQKTLETENLEVNAASVEGLVPEAPVNTTLDTTAKNYYQAIGWLRGIVRKGEERYYVQIRDADFTLYLPRRAIAIAAALEGKLAWIKCYPQSKGEGLSFKVVWMGTEQHEKSDPGIFVLRGVWQFIPQCRRPVFSVYRNELKSYENRPNNQHLPLIWSDQPPYRFRKDSEDRPKFYQILARLIPQRNCFGFVEQIADPVEQTPRRVKKTPFNAEGSDKKPEQGQRAEKREKKPDSLDGSETKDQADGTVSQSSPDNNNNQLKSVAVPGEEVSPNSAESTEFKASKTRQAEAKSPEQGLEKVSPPEEVDLSVVPGVPELMEVSTEPAVTESPQDSDILAEPEVKKTTRATKAKTTKAPKTNKTAKSKAGKKNTPPEA
ncbi:MULTISPECIES: hypothetical protein [unclassified Synechocystis]|uniref:hypothetical protein n=1 Tax=unclassified Synechocystis TaxID=2640012 RepID=UPI0004047A62|nr:MULTISPECIES: hypothetical protein [unclassified Synechocystis]AIE75190.1 hypothetical protein D082_26620 [Synechocystis sp. PCC 6714]